MNNLTQVLESIPDNELSLTSKENLVVMVKHLRKKLKEYEKLLMIKNLDDDSFEI